MICEQTKSKYIVYLKSGQSFRVWATFVDEASDQDGRRLMFQMDGTCVFDVDEEDVDYVEQEYVRMYGFRTVWNGGVFNEGEAG